MFLLFPSNSMSTGSDAIQNWIQYESAVRDGLLAKDKARIRLPAIMKDLEAYCTKFTFGSSAKWTFPLKGYGVKSMGGKDGNGFKPDIVYGASPIKGYSFFDGNRHGGHPAHDIFIYDKNQDMLDDASNQPVDVLSMTDAIVLSTYQSWTSGNNLRGGNMAWLYNPSLNILLYYAHLNKVYVQPGAFVAAGESIGTVGRTGLLAYKKSSPTHIHLMVLKFSNGNLIPYDFYFHLK